MQLLTTGKMAATGNLSAVFQNPRENFVLEDAPIPEPKENEVLVSVHSVGICGSDIHLWTDGSVAGLPNVPRIMGHEFSGTVVKIGGAVTRVKIGDRVTVDPSVVCNSQHCAQCSIARNNLCPDLRICGCSGSDGALRRFHTCLEVLCYKLPDNVGLEEGALVEPLSIAVHGCRKANVAYGTTVLISGCGPIGILSLLAAKALGASKACVTDVVPSRLELAKELGADFTLLVEGETEAVAKKVGNLFGQQPDVTLECTGLDAGIQLAIFATKPGGIISLVGLGGSISRVSLTFASLKELDLRGAILSPRCFPVAIDMISSGKVNVKPLIGHRFKLEEVNEAFALAVARPPNSMKTLVQPGVV